MSVGTRVNSKSEGKSGQKHKRAWSAPETEGKHIQYSLLFVCFVTA